MHVNFQGTVDPTGFEVVDTIEQRRLQFVTGDEVTTVDTDPDRFPFPVETTCRVSIEKLQLNRLDAMSLRRIDGSFVRKLESKDEFTAETGQFAIDISAPIKIYCSVTAPFTVTTGSGSLAIEFPEETSIVVGARSYHEQPAATIETTEAPGDVLRAIESLSSALKDQTCERSYPTLRGHPPRIRLGEELSIPEDVTPSDTGVEISVPREFDYIFPVAPLAFYTGASLEFGDEPTLRTANQEFSLADGDFEDTVAQTLKQSLFLDCVVRTEGLYQFDLQERAAVGEMLPFDPAAVYDLPLHEQLEEYLQIPYETIAEHVPTWGLTAHLPPTASNVTALPYILHDLGVVRNADGIRRTVETSAGADATATVRSTIDRSRSQEANDSVDVMTVEPYTVGESVEHAWFGDDIPVGASKAVTEAFENRLSVTDRSETIDITVVCNDERMLDEHEKLDTVYGQREDLPFSVQTYFGLSMDNLADVLERDDSDFLHYIGHATPDGLQCMDGELDIATLDQVGVDVFLLNACRSYDQALSLIRKGATGGVGTITDVINEDAVETGRLLAKLLNIGFPLRAAVNLMREFSEIGDRYLIVGDGSVDIAQSEIGSPVVCDVSKNCDGTYDLEVEFYPTRNFKIGSVSSPGLESVTQHCILPGRIGPITLSEDELSDYLFWQGYPVRNDGRLLWNGEMSSVDFDTLR